MYNNVHFSLDAPDPHNVRTIDMGCLPMIAAMHKYGIRVDVPFLAALDSTITTSMADTEAQAITSIGPSYQDFDSKKRQPFSIGSPDHVARLLFKHLKLAQPGEVQLTKAGKREAVDDDVLSLLANRHPVVPLISNWRELSKLHSTYTGEDCIRALVKDSRIHTEFTVTVAATGRLSSRRPNCQNIPVRSKLGKEVRNAFISSPGYVLVSCDLSQIEMRWAAHRSQDPTMCAVFWNKEDIHTRTTCNVFGEDYAKVAAIAARCDNGTADPVESEWYKDFKNQKRLACKTVGFGVLYGQTPDGLQRTLAKENVYWTLEQCADLSENKFFAVYPYLRIQMEADYSTVRRYAMSWDDFGRVRLVPEAKSVHKWIANEGIRKAGNHPYQSAAQCGLKLAMAELHDTLIPNYGPDVVRPLLQIHDELILEVHKDLAELFAGEASYVLQQAVPLGVPVESSSDIAERWGELK